MVARVGQDHVPESAMRSTRALSSSAFAGTLNPIRHLRDTTSSTPAVELT